MGVALADPIADALIRQWLAYHGELLRRLELLEADAVSLPSAAWSDAGTLEAVRSSPDPGAATDDAAHRLAAATAQLRAVRKARLQGLRRQADAYRAALGYPSPPTVGQRSGRTPLAIQSVGPDGIRQIEGRPNPPDPAHQPPTPDSTDPPR